MGLFSRLIGKADTLYYPGCTTYYKHKNKFKLYQQIFSKLGIMTISGENIVCCGLPALELGYESEARKLARKKLDLLKANGIKRIITNCPDCYKMFSQNYPEFLPDWNVEIIDIWKLILEKLVSKPKLIKNRVQEKVTYHDSCYLGRYCGIYDSPRHILELIGYTIEEMSDSKENSICAGSCGNLEIINSELADKIARQRLLQAKRTGTKKLIVSSMKNYELLKRNVNDIDIEVLELSEVLAKALDIERDIEGDSDVGKEQEQKNNGDEEREESEEEE